MDNGYKTVKDILKNYLDMEKSIVKQLNFHVQHPTTIGGYREEIWRTFFEQIIPKKFSIERSVFIIDSSGNVSNEVDLAIFDEQYTPYIFRYGTLKFIPIEAVAVVIECKSKTIEIDKWSESINSLETSFNSIARMATSIVINNDEKINNYIKQLQEDENNNGNSKRKIPIITQSSTRPIKILCCVNDENISDEKKQHFDFVVQANSKNNKLEITCKNDERNLAYWHNSLNHYKKEIDNVWQDSKQNVPLKNYEVSGNPILTLIFQLNQLLMLINNPLLFPHMSYVNLFNNIKSEQSDNKQNEVTDIKDKN